LRAAISEVWGTCNVPEDEDDFTPHVSLAYSNRDGDMQPVLDAATAVSYHAGRGYHLSRRAHPAKTRIVSSTISSTSGRRTRGFRWVGWVHGDA
jgi:hypothetical protein